MLSLAAKMHRVRRVLVSSILPILSLAALGSVTPLMARAQYPGHIEARKEKPPVLRSIAVLEWVGEAGKPSASRVVPVSVYDGKTYQDGGIYMASPAPLAVEGETEYQLFQTGVLQGTFDIVDAGVDGNGWFGYGIWKRIHETPPPKLPESKVKAQVVADADPSRPHFKSNSSDSSSSPDQKDASPAEAKPAPKPADDDDKPTLKRRSSDSTTSPGSGTTQAPAPASSTTGSKPASDDPDRPKLRKRSTQADPATPQEAVTAVNKEDPDRPKLRRGPQTVPIKSDYLTGNPVGLQQMIAVSDATYHEPHSYAYEWAGPDDAQKMQAALEQIARDALNAKKAVGKATIPAKTATKTAGKTAPATTRTRAAAKKNATPSTTPQFVDEEFKAFELAYSGGSTLVFTARTIDDGTPIRYITLIAQPDFYGAAQVIFKQVTDVNHLNFTPRLRLIDAVDTDADNRAELVFEQRSKSDRQFAIYSVKSNRVEQVFSTGPLQ